MQTSFDSDKWVESQVDQAQRRNLGINDPIGLKRRLFPLIARVVKADNIYQEPVGTILTFARTKMTPASFPIEAIIFQQGGVGHIQAYNSDEVEILGTGV